MHPPRSHAGALLLSLLAGGCALIPEHTDDPRPRIRGPIPSRVQEPIKLGTLGFRPRRAATQRPGHVSLGIESAYSNMFQNGTGDGLQEVILDGEIWTNTLVTTVGISERADVELDLGLLYASNGFLDGLIEDYHHWFGFPGGGRDERPRDNYEMHADIGGRRVYQLTPYEFELLDTPLVFTERVVDEDERTPAIALRVGVDLPTGSQARGTGNGGWDWGAGLLAEKTLGRWSFTGALDWVDAKRPSSFVGSGVDVYDGFDVQLGVEYRWNDELSLLTGLVLTPPATRQFTIKELDREVLGLDVGAAWDTGENSVLHAGFEEDLLSASGPDIVFFVGWKTEL
ncbi:MAG: DUF3187 family protein [Planctomycetes bacterium]|nr:DUF3187 family protein [Planctomycetota bacterium]